MKIHYVNINQFRILNKKYRLEDMSKLLYQEELIILVSIITYLEQQLCTIYSHLQTMSVNYCSTHINKSVLKIQMNVEFEIVITRVFNVQSDTPPCDNEKLIIASASSN